MSSTRRATDGEFHQERFCSSPELEGDAINALMAAKRIALVRDSAAKELLWWIQWRSLTPNGLHKLSDELRGAFPDRFGTTPTLRKFYQSKRATPTAAELDGIAAESRHCGSWFRMADYFSAEDLLDDDDYLTYSRQKQEAPQPPPPTPRPSARAQGDEYKSAAAEAAENLPDFLRKCCVDPDQDIARGCWYFIDLPGALFELRARSIAAAKARIADTAVSRQINGTLDFWAARRRMILIEGVARIGRTATLRAWCDAQGGLVRYVEVPSSADDRSFYVSIARELGVARGLSFSGQQIKLRVEETLRESGLMLAFDESQYLWGNALRPRRTPDRILWIKTAFDAGTPIALVAHTDFSKWQEHFVKRTLWTDEQFEGRINRRVILATAHTSEDLLRIARAHFPSGDDRSWKLLTAYALSTPKKRASAIVEALESARYRAQLQGRAEATFRDIEAALREEHAFLQPPAPALAQPRAVATPPAADRGNGAASLLQAPRKSRAQQGAARADSDFPIVGRDTGRRINTPSSATLAG